VPSSHHNNAASNVNVNNNANPQPGKLSRRIINDRRNSITQREQQNRSCNNNNSNDTFTLVRNSTVNIQGNEIQPDRYQYSKGGIANASWTGSANYITLKSDDKDEPTKPWTYFQAKLHIKI